MTMKNDNNQANPNKDPITGSHGTHPLGTGIGAVGVGAATGAVGGAVAGPIGAVAGAVIGAVAGGIAGKATAEALNPTVEGKYWQDNYASRPYARTTLGYEQYAPAYRYGWESFGRNGNSKKSFDAAESDLSRGWNEAKGSSTLGWDQAKPAARDAWERVELAAGCSTKDKATCATGTPAKNPSSY